MTWCFYDEENDLTELILDSFKSSKAIVPSPWSLEVANVVLLAKNIIF